MTHQDAEEFGSAPNEPHDPQGRPVKSPTMKCKYCNGDCPESDKNNTDFMCDGYLGDIDNLYREVRQWRFRSGRR